MFDLSQFNISAFFFKSTKFFNSEFPLISDPEPIVETSVANVSLNQGIFGQNFTVKWSLKLMAVLLVYLDELKSSSNRFSTYQLKL